MNVVTLKHFGFGLGIPATYQRPPCAAAAPSLVATVLVTLVRPRQLSHFSHAPCAYQSAKMVANGICSASRRCDYVYRAPRSEAWGLHASTPAHDV